MDNNIYWVILVGLVLLYWLLVYIVRAWRDIQVAKATGTDPEDERQRTEREFWKDRS